MRSGAPQCDVKWTMVLLRRDIRTLKTKFSTKLKNKFGCSRAVKDVSVHQEVKTEEVENEVVENETTAALPEDHQYCSSVTEAASTETATMQTVTTETTSAETTSMKTATTNTKTTETGTDTTSTETTITQDASMQTIITETASKNSVSTKPVQNSHAVAKFEAKKTGNTLYEVLGNELKALYASRDRDMSHQDRWRFRGSWLVLHMAIQACPSNDSYNIFRGGEGPPEESKFLLDLLQRSIEHSQVTTAKASKMPAEPYTEQNINHARYDSMFRDTGTSTPLPARVWLAILQDTKDSTKIGRLAEELLRYLYPGKNAIDILDQMGNPNNSFHDDDDADLRARLRLLLYPEYEALTSKCI